MNKEVEEFADYLIEWITGKGDMEFDRYTEFNIIRMIVDAVECYESEQIEDERRKQSIKNIREASNLERQTKIVEKVMEEIEEGGSE